MRRKAGDERRVSGFESLWHSLVDAWPGIGGRATAEAEDGSDPDPSNTFDPCDLHPDALAALGLFRRAALCEALGAVEIQRLIRYLQAVRTGPTASHPLPRDFLAARPGLTR